MHTQGSTRWATCCSCSSPRLLSQQDTAGCHTLLTHRENQPWAYCKTGDSIRPQKETLSHHDLVITENATSELCFNLVYLRLPLAGPKPGMHAASLLGDRLGRSSLWSPSAPPEFGSTPYSQPPSRAHTVLSPFPQVIWGFGTIVSLLLVGKEPMPPTRWRTLPRNLRA